ncbi:MAG: hypothetical protein IJV66_01365 [Firmicutes bacterium]|nr:hypothetical protein [Bacillota bacterium]
MSSQKGTLTDRVNERYPRKENGRTYLGTGVASVLIALIVLVIACFAALTYLSADSKMELSEKSKVYCDNYYAAETAASKLLDGIISGSAEPEDSSGVKSIYNTDSGKVTVTKSGNYVTFKIAINENQSLNVEADVKDDKARITTWAVE